MTTTTDPAESDTLADVANERATVISLRLTKDEYKAWAAAAKADGDRPLSNWIRAQCNASLPPPTKRKARR